MLIAHAELDGELRKKFGPSDLVQETCLHAQRGFADFQGTTNAELRAWLRQIMLNRCRNAQIAYRHTDKRDVGRECSTTGTSSVLGPFADLAGDATSPSGQAIAGEEALQVARAMASLPKDYEEVIRLRNWEDLGFKEIATRMGRSPRRCENSGIGQSSVWAPVGKQTIVMTQTNGHNDDASHGSQKRLIELMAEYQESLVGGTPFAAADSRKLDADSQAAFARAQQVLERLARVRPLFHATESTKGTVSLGSITAANGHEGTATPDLMHASELPKTFGRFEIVSMLGHGGLGVVLLARDPLLGRLVALKIPRPEAP